MTEEYPANIFASFPVEVAQQVLAQCHPWDVATFSKTCRAAYALVYLSADQYLWRQLYLNHFDGPQLVAHKSAKNVASINWKEEVTARLSIELALFLGPPGFEEQRNTFRKLVTVLHESSNIVAPSPAAALNRDWIRHIVLDSNILSNLYTVSLPKRMENKQLLARLRSYLCLTLDPKEDEATFELLNLRRNTSRAYVYDLRHYTAKTNYGPFRPDGTVDWIHVDNIISVISMNIRELPGSWASTRPPSILDEPTANVGTQMDVLAPPRPFHDWAGVQGIWRRYVCFMDYRDLFAFNFTDLADGPLNVKFFADPMFREAIRLIEVQLELIPSDAMRFHTLPEIHWKQNPNFPPLCFKGVSKGVNGNEATVEGYVLMGKDDTVRWQMVRPRARKKVGNGCGLMCFETLQTSIYDARPQWSSSGVQVGGVKSMTGVVGTWTTTHHDEDDPAGPFWLWKVEDGSPTHLMEFT